MSGTVPEVVVAPAIAEAMAHYVADRDLSALERLALDPSTPLLSRLPFSTTRAWEQLLAALRDRWAAEDHIVVRGLPPDDEGKITLLVGAALVSRFRPYRGNRIVKHFKMSPWTTALSQTTQDGHFHTDLNTDAHPPCVTIIHCKDPDPSPAHGRVHVARLSALLDHLRHTQQDSVLRFLCETDVEMVNERSPTSRIGHIVDRSQATVQFHPETLRAAAKRGGLVPTELEDHLTAIHRSALEVSAPILLDRGDALLVSNTRALHYRGPCTVRFFDFPRGFEAREIFVLHLIDEPQWPT